MHRPSTKGDNLTPGALLDVEALAAFVGVARERSFTRAAKAMSTPKSTLSKRVGALEARLGLRLLQRSTRAVQVTDAGRVLLERAGRLLADLEDAERAVVDREGAPRGLVRLTAPALVSERLLGPILLELLGQWPSLSLDVVSTDRLVDVIAEGFDVAVRTGSPADSSLIARRLRPWSNVICASPAYVERRGAPRAPDDLREHACIVFKPPAIDPVWSLRRGRRTASVPVRGRYTVSTQELALDAARAGLGIANLAEFLVEEDVRRGALVSLLPRWTVPRGDLYLLYPSNRYMGSGARAVIDALMKRLTSRAASPAGRPRAR
ncbi:LysR substrate-binding domain-containing protein [Sorangium sp. So ce1099]|uniref:substrate binding domain-containing protein n=1 Tax=Sorangium sp. So ce1099 TaxID=3133331 RepID=UPI003F5F9352